MPAVPESGFEHRLVGLSTGMPMEDATRSIAGPNAEQVNRIATAPPSRA
jgi:hypothetical protein